MACIVLHRPTPGEVVFIEPKKDDTFALNFDSDEAQIERHEQDLVLTFDHDAQLSGIVMTNFYQTYTLDSMPENIFDFILAKMNDSSICDMFYEENPVQFFFPPTFEFHEKKFSSFEHCEENVFLHTNTPRNQNFESSFAHISQNSESNTIDQVYFTDIIIENVLAMEGEEGIDILLASVDSLPQVKSLLEQGTFENINTAELIVLADNIGGTTVNEVLTNLNLVRNGTELKQGEGSTWTDTLHSNVVGYQAYTNSQDITILIKSNLLIHS